MMNNNTTVSGDIHCPVSTARELTHVLATRVMPITVLILFEAVLGLFGNILILIVYSKYYKRSNFRYFILCLGFIDLLSCCTTLPAEAYVQMNWYSFENDALCKVKSYLNVFTIFASALTLMLLASDRYQKICHPFSRQIEPQVALRLCIISILVSMVISIPTAIFWGVQSYDFTYKNVTIPVTICEKSEYYSEGIYPMIYITSAFCVPIGLLMLITVYFNIAITWKIFFRTNLTSRDTAEHQHCTTSNQNENGVHNVNIDYQGEIKETRPNSELNRGNDTYRNSRLLKHKCFIFRVLHCTANDSKTQTNEHTALRANEQVVPCKKDTPTKDALEQVCGHQNVKRTKCVENHNNISNGTNVNGIPNHTESNVKHAQVDIRVCTSKQRKHCQCPVGSPTSRQPSRERRETWRNNVVNRSSLLVNCQRKTLIMIILSTVFLLSMAVYFALTLLVADVSSILRHMSTSQTVVFFFFWRLYFVNSAINPVLYGLMDKRFRQGLTKLCCKCRV